MIVLHERMPLYSIGQLRVFIPPTELLRVSELVQLNSIHVTEMRNFVCVLIELDVRSVIRRRTGLVYLCLSTWSIPYECLF
jgi:hypothetical protein